MWSQVLRLGLLFVLCATPAFALGPEDPHEIGGFVGYFRGDELSSYTPSPILDDGLSFGAFYVRHFNDRWGFMTRVSTLSSDISNLRNGAEVGADLTFVDFSATYQWNWRNFSVYVPVGLGYTWANFDRPLIKPIGGAVGSDDDFGFHAGVGLAWPLKDRLVLRFEGRYRIAGDLLAELASSADFFEATAGAGWTF